MAHESEQGADTRASQLHKSLADEERSVPTTLLRKIKRGDGWGRWAAYVLAEDSYGTWAFTPSGSTYRGQVGDRVVELEVGQGSRPAGLAVLQLLPAQWWTATWWDAEAIISVDVCTPPQLIDGEWRYVDLELDPHRYPDGRVVIEDEDEFEAACRAGTIRVEEAAAARKAADEVLDRLRAQVEPFGDVGWSFLRQALQLELSPLVEKEWGP